MPRPQKCRRVCQLPGWAGFTPVGERPGPEEPVVLTVDEFEVIRLLDLEGLTRALAPRFYGLTLRDRTRVQRAVWDRMEEDNVAMCKARTGLPVLALVQDDMERFPMDGQALAQLYDEVK